MRHSIIVENMMTQISHNVVSTFRKTLFGCGYVVSIKHYMRKSEYKTNDFKSMYNLLSITRTSTGNTNLFE